MIWFSLKNKINTTMKRTEDQGTASASLYFTEGCKGCSWYVNKVRFE